MVGGYNRCLRRPVPVIYITKGLRAVSVPVTQTFTGWKENGPLPVSAFFVLSLLFSRLEFRLSEHVWLFLLFLQNRDPELKEILDPMDSLPAVLWWHPKVYP